MKVARFLTLVLALTAGDMPLCAQTGSESVSPIPPSRTNTSKAPPPPSTIQVPQIPETKVAPPPLPLPKKEVPTGPHQFFSPGTLSFRAGEWVGSDQLAGLGKNIGVIVEIAKPAIAQFNLTEEQIRRWVEERFVKMDIIAQPDFQKFGGPFPTFHILIMVYPLDKQFVAYVSGRLLESVQLERVPLAPGVFFQAITWERENLIHAANKDLFNEVQKHVLQITDAFLSRKTKH